MIDRDGKWASREGLVTVGVLPQRQVQQAILRSLPRITDAMRLAEKVVARLGERLHHDVMAGPGNRLLFLRDAELPAHLKATEPPLPPPERPAVLPGPDRFPGKLRVAEGPAHLDLTYGRGRHPHGDGAVGRRHLDVGLPPRGPALRHRPAREARAVPAHRAVLPPRPRPGRTRPRHPRRDGRRVGPRPAREGPCVRPGAHARWSRRVLAARALASPGGALGRAHRRGRSRLGGLRRLERDGRGRRPNAGRGVRRLARAPRAHAAASAARAAFRRRARRRARRAPVVRVRRGQEDRDLLDGHDPPRLGPARDAGLAGRAARERSRRRRPTPTAAARPARLGRLRLHPACAPRRRARRGLHRLRPGRGPRPTGASHLSARVPFPRSTRARSTPPWTPSTWSAGGRSRIEESGFWVRRNPYTNPEYPWMVPTYRVWDDLGRSPQHREGGMGWSAEVAVRGLDADQMSSAGRTRAVSASTA